MSEYFEISFIVRKTDNSKENLYKCLFKKTKLVKGKNVAGYFNNREILVSDFEDGESDFDEIYISIPEQIFHKPDFKKELELFTSFITVCFECCKELEFVLCSYELNGFLLRNIKNISQLDDKLLYKFPIVYKREINNDQPKLMLYLFAQDIFVSE